MAETIVSREMWQDMAERMAKLEQAAHERSERDKTMESRQLDMQRDLKYILDFMNKASGGIRVILWIGGGASAAGAAVAWLLGHVSIRT